MRNDGKQARDRATLFLIAVLLLCLACLAGCGSSYAMTDLPVFEPLDECTFAGPSGYKAECGYVIVPEDRHDPKNKNVIKLYVVVFRSSSPAPAPDPLIYLHGGPGGIAVYQASYLLQDVLNTFLPGRDVITFDQRGAGFSEPSLDCTGQEGFFLEHLDMAITTREYSVAQTDSLLKCREQLIEQGVNLAAYTSAQNAADVDDVRAALGYEQVNLLGASYGTRLALTVMRDHPEHVRSAILDSVAPLETHAFNERAINFQAALDRMFAKCAADPDCNQTYPNLEATFYDLVDELNADPVAVSISHPFSGARYQAQVSGDRLIEVVFRNLYYTDSLTTLPRMIVDVRAGKYDVLSQNLALPLQLVLLISEGMYYSIMCAEEADFSSYDEVLAINAEAKLAPQVRAYFNDYLYQIYGTCEQWDAAMVNPVEIQPVISGIPTLVLAGEYDPITPPRWSKQAAANLSNSFYFEFMGGAHGLIMSNHCALQIAAQFIADPSREPDSACMARLRDIDFTP